MAECGLETITVTGATGYTDANGVYTKTSANSYQNTNGVVFAYAGSTGSYGPGWYIVKTFPRYFAAQDPADCPSGLTFEGKNGVVGSFTLLDTVPNTIYVSDAGVSLANGTYTRGANSGGYPTWTNENGYEIRIDSDGPGFKVWKFKNGLGHTLYTSQSNQFASATWPGEWPGDSNASPAIVLSVSVPFGQTPIPTLSLTPPPTPSQNTFGLPADVVALITSRFGSVARFLRLRNQGQI